MPTLKTTYGTWTQISSSGMLDNLFSDSNYLAGRATNLVDNTVAGYDDYMVACAVKTDTLGSDSAALLQLWVIPEPALLPSSGLPVSEGAYSFSNSGRRNSFAVQVGSSPSIAGLGGTIYGCKPVGISQFFGGVCPSKFVLWLVQGIGTLYPTGSLGGSIWYQGISRTLV